LTEHEESLIFRQASVSKHLKPRDSSGVARRRPTQARSQRRYDAIVDAAAAAFADFGFEATTMEGIAARASTSIGSLYQFFPNKHALFRVVARECLAKSRRVLEDMVIGAPIDPGWQPLLERVIDAYRELQRDVFMQAIWRNIALYGEWAEDDEALFREFVGVTSGLLAMWAPSLEPERRKIVGSTIINAITGAMMQLSRTNDEAEADLVIEETKRMLARYLAAYVDR
jgi:AcrR family transcriptional regulator